jgi:DNA polymerase-3 subunit epsilon
MGYLDTEMGITDLSEIREYVTPYPSNQYITDLLYTFAQNIDPSKVRIQPKESVGAIRLSRM